MNFCGLTKAPAPTDFVGIVIVQTIEKQVRETQLAS